MAYGSPFCTLVLSLTNGRGRCAFCSLPEASLRSIRARLVSGTSPFVWLDRGLMPLPCLCEAQNAAGVAGDPGQRSDCTARGALGVEMPTGRSDDLDPGRPGEVS